MRSLPGALYQAQAEAYHPKGMSRPEAAGFYSVLPRLVLRTPRASVCLEAKAIFNVSIACWSSTSDQVENASFASVIEQVHHLTVILPHRMQGIIPSLRSRDRSAPKKLRATDMPRIRLVVSDSWLEAAEELADGSEPLTE
jgi:hypothetical protein